MPTISHVTKIFCIVLAHRYSHLMLAFDRNRGTGIQTLLQEKDGNGRMRATKSSAIAKRIADHLGSERPNSSNTVSQTTLDHASGSAAAAEAAASPPVPTTPSRAMPQLSAQTLALYRRRRENGYDLLDPYVIVSILHYSNKSKAVC